MPHPAIITSHCTWWETSPPVKFASDCDAELRQNDHLQDFCWCPEIKQFQIFDHRDLISSCNLCVMKWRKGENNTAKPLGSGHAALGNRLTAIRWFCSSLPLYTKFGAFSPLSDTMKSALNPFVANFSDSNEYSLKAGTSSGSGRNPFSAHSTTLTVKCQIHPLFITEEGDVHPDPALWIELAPSSLLYRFVTFSSFNLPRIHPRNTALWNQTLIWGWPFLGIFHFTADRNYTIPLHNQSC